MPPGVMGSVDCLVVGEVDESGVGFWPAVTAVLLPQALTTRMSTKEASLGSVLDMPSECAQGGCAA